MKLNNKGFAITAVLYGLLILFVILVSSYLLILSLKKDRVETLVSDIEDEYNDSTFDGEEVDRNIYVCERNVNTNTNHLAIYHLSSCDGDNCIYDTKNGLDKNIFNQELDIGNTPSWKFNISNSNSYVNDIKVDSFTTSGITCERELLHYWAIPWIPCYEIPVEADENFSIGFNGQMGDINASEILLYKTTTRYKYYSGIYVYWWYSPKYNCYVIDEYLSDADYEDV